MKTLRIHVERIVRPIRASVPRKNKMREELLAHLSSAYENERTEVDTDAKALERAKRRLGDPDALREELQATVPWYERLGYTRIPLRLQILENERCTSYGWRASARFANEVILMLLALSPILAAIAYVALLGRDLSRPEPLNVMDGLLTIAGFLVCLWISLFVAFWLFDLIGARIRTTPWSTTPAFIKACLSTTVWLFTIGLFLAMSAGFVDFLQQPSAPEETRTVLLAAISAIPFAPWMGLFLVASLILTMTVAMRFEHRQYERWGCLDVESE